MEEKFILIAGPCVAESLELCRQVAESILELTHDRPVAYFFKSSFDKANRTSLQSYRGPGLQTGLKILQQIKDEFQIPVLTDIHTPDQAQTVGKVVDAIQIPAFLCRQTDLLVAAAQTGKQLNIKKGQFLAADSMRHAVAKVKQTNPESEVWVTERGNSFGYSDLIVDFRNLSKLQTATQCPVILDATHAAQQPSTSSSTGGNRQDARLLARAGAAAGIDGLFCEVHPDPDQAKSDGPNSMDFELFKRTLDEVLRIRRALTETENH